MKQFDRAELDRRLRFPHLMGACSGCSECDRYQGSLKLTLAVLDAQRVLDRHQETRDHAAENAIEYFSGWVRKESALISARNIAVKACIDAGLGK